MANVTTGKLHICAAELRYLRTNPIGNRVLGEEQHINTHEERTGIFFADRTVVEIICGFLTWKQGWIKASPSEWFWRPTEITIVLGRIVGYNTRSEGVYCGKAKTKLKVCSALT